MSFKVYINNGIGEVDYTRYVAPSTIQIQQSINLPTTCTITFNGWDAAFVVPTPRAYIRVYSTLYKRNIFTGLLTVEPSSTFIGLNQNVPNNSFKMYSYGLSFTSDEYLLNIKSVPYIPAFVNQTQGAILKAIAETLAPGYYDFSYMASGDLVPYLAYDPTQSWSDIAKTFCDASRYRYFCINRQIHYLPYNDGPLGISYDDTGPEASFDPNALSVTPMTTPIVNDVTMIGQQEAGNNHEDYFIGTGFTGAFPLNYKVYGLSTNFQGSSVLLSDGWNQQLNTQNWFVQDPAGQFNYSAGALNIVAGFSLPTGLSYIYANNALELAGGIVIQHGEIVFNNSSTGTIGGIYEDTSMADNKCIAGFAITPTQTVNVTISGASGISIQPTAYGVPMPQGFNVITKINKSYTLYTKITAPTPVRTYQVFRTIAGYMYGGNPVPATTPGTITWTVLETDAYSGVYTYYHYTQSDANLPDTAIYGLISNNELNITLTTTEVWTPPPGSLSAQCVLGAGLLAPIYISGNVQYTGAFVTPSGGNLPIVGSDFGVDQLFDMGSGIGNQAAELDSGTLTDTLNFYSNDLPGVGVRIKLQAWESQAAQSRVRIASSVAEESAVVGDDGVRSSVVQNLNPLPRTSEDCDNAAQAYLSDRVNTFYQGSYNASYIFFKQFTSDLEFYPVCGRFLKVNSPQQGINNEEFVVTAITTTITEMAGEIITYSLTFGPDLYLDKMLAQLIPTPTNVLEPLDTAITLTPIDISRIGDYYLPDVEQTTLAPQSALGGTVNVTFPPKITDPLDPRFNLQPAYTPYTENVIRPAAPIRIASLVTDNTCVNGTQIVINFQDTLQGAAVYEVREVDLNWGMADSTLLARVNTNGPMAFARDAYDQSWYIRMVSGALIPIGGDNTQYNVNNIATSRRTKIIRVVYPQIPSAPALLYADSANVQMDFSGDVRSVEGIEIREADDLTVVYEAIVGSRYDLGINMDALRGQLLPGEVGLTGLGQYLLGQLSASGRVFNAHFFNLMWEYGPALQVTMPAPSAPTISEAYRWGPALQINVQVAPVDALRSDINFTIMQFFGASGLTDDSLIQSVQQVGNSGFITSNVPVTGDIYARCTLVDHISSGAWSNTLFVPQGNLIASDYLAAQGSVPPAITSANGGSGGIFTYTSTESTVTMDGLGFGVLYPNGAVDEIQAVSQTFSGAIDTESALTPATFFGFFPYVLGPTTPNPNLVFNGPYLSYSTVLTNPALSGMFADGAVPMTNGAFVVQTASSGGTGGGGGGGTHGGSSCGTLDRKIRLWLSREITLDELRVGDFVTTSFKKRAIVERITRLKEQTYRIRTASGLETRGSVAHTLKSGEEWLPLEEVIVRLQDGLKVSVVTENSLEDELVFYEDTGIDWVAHIHLKSPNDEYCDHTYILDKFITHNTVVKNNTP